MFLLTNNTNKTGLYGRNSVDYKIGNKDQDLNIGSDNVRISTPLMWRVIHFAQQGLASSSYGR